MAQGPLVKEEIDAGAKFLAELEKAMPVLAAFWLRTNEEDPGHLYVTFEPFDDQSRKAGYREVVRIIGEMRDPNLGFLRVRIINPDDPRSKTALDFLRLYPGRIPIRLRDPLFGDRIPDEVYIYPKPVTVS
jgi:hypothetical protein